MRNKYFSFMTPPLLPLFGLPLFLICSPIHPIPLLAILFSVLSFSGAWALFTTFYRRYPHLSTPIAIACLFIPSVIFWGSGILKDTIVLASLGFLTFCIDRIFIQHRLSLVTISVFVVSLFTIYVIRKFVLQAFIPSAILWVYFKHLANLKSTVLKIILAPLILFIFLITSYYSVIKVGEGDSKYSLEKLAETSQITAYDIGFYTGANAGSNYSLGNLNGSLLSMVQLAPQAINVSLFRPYLWEVKNALMLLSAIEALFFLSITLYIVVKKRFNLMVFFTDPNSIFCLLFSVSYAFAVGISTFNFGTLVRYRTVLLPFYLLCIVIINNYRETGVEKNTA